MAEFFKGVKDFFDFRSEQEKQFDRMLDAYRGGNTEAHREMAKGIEQIMSLSPDLKARTLAAIGDGHLRSYSDQAVDGAGAASYQVSDRSIRVPPGFDGYDRTYMETMFVLGHETEHARSMKGVNPGQTQLLPEIQRIAQGDGPLPRDYTDAINAYAERTRAEEGRAHLGGFNAIASYVVEARAPKPRHLLRELYEAHPERMGDFIDKTSVGLPVTYALKPGLTLAADGRLPYSQGNIDAMKVHYADKAQLGAPHMNYRQEAIQFATELVKGTERVLAETEMVNRDYVIDPARLQAHPALGLPPDGRLQARGEVEIAHLDLAHLGPLIVEQAPSVPGASMDPPSQASSSSPTLPTSPVPSLVPRADDPPLFAQALDGVAALHAQQSLGSAQDVRNLAASLAVSAQERGLHGIDSVTHSEDRRGVIATQGSGDVALSARVDAMGGIAVPEATSLGRLTPSPSLDPSQAASQTPGLTPQPAASLQKV